MQKELMSNSNVMAIHTLMQSNAGTVVRIDDLNVDKMKLGTPDGTVDLQTGMLSQADPADLITKTTTVSPAAPGKIIWGAGPVFQFPTATDDKLGTNKWSGGAGAVGNQELDVVDRIIAVEWKDEVDVQRRKRKQECLSHYIIHVF